jgi:hypothetical protein
VLGNFTAWALTLSEHFLLPAASLTALFSGCPSDGGESVYEVGSAPRDVPVGEARVKAV